MSRVKEDYDVLSQKYMELRQDMQIKDSQIGLLEEIKKKEKAR